MSKRIFYEILASRENIESPSAFELVFTSLHKVYDEIHSKHKVRDTFSFEIAKVGNKIRFFVSSPEKYAKYLRSQIFAHYKDLEINEVKDYLSHIPTDKFQVGVMDLSKHHLYPIKDIETLQEPGAKTQIDPFAAITSTLAQSSNLSITVFQVVFHPIDDASWKKDVDYQIEIITSKYPKAIKKALLSKYYKYAKIAAYPVFGIMKVGKWVVNPFSWADEIVESADPTQKEEWEWLKIHFYKKVSHPGYEVSVNLVYVGEEKNAWRLAIKELSATTGIYSAFANNSLRTVHLGSDEKMIHQVKKRNLTSHFILNTKELAGLVHIPTSYVTTPSINWLGSRAFEPPLNLPVANLQDSKSTITPLWKTNFRGNSTAFGILPDDRRRHIYIIGKTWMGKSTLLENMIISDMNAGRWVAVVDPHGDLAEAVIWHIPKNRTNHTIIFDPSDKHWPISFNMLEDINPEHRSLVASGLVGIFKKIFWDSWGPRLEHTLRNTILALLEYPNSTLISIPLMLTSDAFRQRVVSKVTDPVVKKFWTHEFGKLNPSQRTETVSPILNKVGQFLSSPLLRNVLGQWKNSFSLRWAMDKWKIIIVNLSKWKIGEDASSLLWAMLITKFQLDAMSRADIPEKDRTDFYLYVDEFQNFATDSFATILSEARKYKLNLVMANQYIDQMPDEVKGAVFGNVWTLVSFQVWPNDAKLIKEALWWTITENDLINAKKYNAYLKLLVDGMPSNIFSAAMFPPIKKDEQELQSRYTKILQVSREKYCKPKAQVEEKIDKMMDDVEKWDKERENYIEEKKKEKLSKDNGKKTQKKSKS